MDKNNLQYLKKNIVHYWGDLLLLLLSFCNQLYQRDIKPKLVAVDESCLQATHPPDTNRSHEMLR